MRVFLLLIGFFLASLTSFSKKKTIPHTLYQFIENKGQFHPKAKYKVEIPNGALFIENSTFTYHFYDAPYRNHGPHGNEPFHKHQEIEPIAYFHAYKVVFNEGNTNRIIASHKTLNHYNYYLGKNPTKWAANVPAYEQLVYKDLYKGIDLKLVGDSDKGLKYDLVVGPNANPNAISISYIGADSVYLKNGKLIIQTSISNHIEEKPYAYQVINGKQRRIACKYVLNGTTLSYEFPNGFDKNVELIIDPVLVFSSYTGATSNNFGYTATYDKFGYLYSGSSSFGMGYPTTLGAYQVNWAGGTGGAPVGIPQITGTDIAISKWDTNGSSLIYSTYLGGSSDELPHSIVVSDYDELYVLGSTGSNDFPTTLNAFDTSFNMHPAGPLPINLLNGLGAYYLNGSDIIVTKFDSNGSNLSASTYIGGTQADGINNGDNYFNYADEIRGEIQLDNNGKVYVVSCTKSSDNPTTNNGFQTIKPSNSGTQTDGIIYKLNHNLTLLEYSSYIGGSADDAAYSIAINDSNDVYVSGGTRSTNFPYTSGGYDTVLNGNNDGFIIHITENGNTILSGSYFGSANYDQSYFVELDHQGNAYIFGQTSAPMGELIENASYNDSLGGQFITKFKPDLDSIIWSTRFGSGDGSPDISPTAFLVDLCNAIYLSGWGSNVGTGGNLSTLNLDTAGNPFQGTTDGNDFYVMVLSDDASTLQYASFFGGSAAEHVDGGTSRFDRKGKVYQAVCACGPTNDFPTTPNALSSVNGASCNLAVFKMDFLLPVVVSDFDVPTVGCAPFTANFTNLSLQQSATNFFWEFGDGSTSSQFNPSHVYTNAGVYTIKLTVNDAATCNLADTLTKQITILSNTNSTLPNVVYCPSDNGVEIGISQNNDPSLSVSWSPSTHLSDTTISNPIANPPVSTTYTLYVNNGVCEDTLIQTILVDSISTSIIADSFVCLFDSPFLLMSNTNIPPVGYHWSNFSDFSDSINNAQGDSSVFVTPTDSINWYYLKVKSILGCFSTDSFPMTVSDYLHPIAASFAPMNPGCAPFQAYFTNTTDSTQNTTYLWDFGNGQTSTQSNPSIWFNQKGVYDVKLIAFDSSICPQSDTFSYQLQVRADSNYSVEQIACLNQETQIGITPDTIPNTTYTWYPATGLSDSTIANPTIITNQNTSYLLVVEHVCTDSVINNITVEPVYAETDSLFIICSDNPTLNTQGNSEGSAVEFIWSTNKELTDTINSSLLDSTINYTQTNIFSTYYFAVKTANGCIEKDSITAVIADKLIETSGDTILCQQDTTQLTIRNLFPYNQLDFYWTPTNQIIGISDTTSIITAPKTTTVFYVQAINDSGCVYNDTATVGVSILNDTVVLASAEDDSIYAGGSTILNVIPENDFIYNWQPSNVLAQPTASTTLASPETTTTFTVWVSDPNNVRCSYKDSVTLEVYEINCGEPNIIIPNAFSPNNDGENDFYQISGQVLERINLQIFNRWGELVFETNQLEQPWDGTYKGKMLDAAVFVYQLEATCVDGQEFSKKGNISLVK